MIIKNKLLELGVDELVNGNVVIWIERGWQCESIEVNKDQCIEVIEALMKSFGISEIKIQDGKES